MASICLGLNELRCPFWFWEFMVVAQFEACTLVVNPLILGCIISVLVKWAILLQIFHITHSVPAIAYIFNNMKNLEKVKFSILVKKWFSNEKLWMDVN